MTDYARYWRPQSEAEAMWSIDTGHFGEAFWQWGRAYHEALEQERPALPGVLDYGCGVGRVLMHFDDELRIGVDVSEEMLALAEKNDPRCLWLKGDGRSIPLPDECVGFAYSLLVLQHMDAADVAAVVREIHRVLLPGGRCYLMFSAFGRRWTPTAVVPKTGHTWTGNPATSHHAAHDTLAYTRDIVNELAEAAGFEQIDVAHIGGEWGYYVLRAQKPVNRATGIGAEGLHCTPALAKELGVFHQPLPCWDDEGEITQFVLKE